MKFILSPISECSICLEYIGNDRISVLDCNHIFHNKCLEISSKVKTKCPICRKDYDSCNTIFFHSMGKMKIYHNFLAKKNLLTKFISIQEGEE